MPETHVFVETNWVVAIVAPTLSRPTAAAELLERCHRKELVLHVPAISLVEAHKVVRERSPRADLDIIRRFVHDLRDAGTLDASGATATFDVLSRFQQYLVREKQEAPGRISALDRETIDVFPLDEQILARSTQLAAETGLILDPFDLSILAAVLVRGAVLRAKGASVAFCTLDSDLQPWDKKGLRKHELANLFDAAGVWVYRDFALENPERPPQ
jgi:predicted nucleic acid-binding protein